MTTQTLTDTLRSLQPKEMTWRFALYSAQKSRDGLTLEWQHCKMAGTADWADTIRTALLEKTTVEKTVSAYSPFLSDKESIAAVERGSELVKEKIDAILSDIKSCPAHAPEDFVSGVLPKTTGFAFFGEGEDMEGQPLQILFMKRGNPFLSGARTRLCTSKGDEIVTAEKPILKFAPAVDFIYIGEVCYFNSSAIEKDFDIESRHLGIAARYMQKVAAAEIVSDYEQLEAAVMSAKHAKKFVDFDSKILEHITRMGIASREEFLLTYGITIDTNGSMDTADPEQCELIIDLLCCRSCLDPLGRLSTGSNITPRE